MTTHPGFRRWRAERDWQLIDELIARARPTEAELERDAMKQVMALAASARAPIDSGACAHELRVEQQGRIVRFRYVPGLTAAGQRRRDREAVHAALTVLSR